MRLGVGALLGLVIALLPLVVRAGNQPDAGAASILSEGATTCGEFVAQPGSQQAIRMEWVLGYISGANSRSIGQDRFVGRSFEQPDTVMGWLQSYCSAHALDVLVTAAEALRKDFIAHERDTK